MPPNPKPANNEESAQHEADLSGIETEVIKHELGEEQLVLVFGVNGWKRLPDDVFKRLTVIPAVFKVEEHHVAVYGGRDNETIIRGDCPVELLRNSIVTPSLAAYIM